MSGDVGRRHFLQLAGTWFLSAGLPAPALARPGGTNRVAFPQGVASGDPYPDAVTLWTRAELPGTDRIDLTVQVSGEESFSSVLVEEKISASRADDYTVRARIGGLHPGRHYYYRFLADSGGGTVTGRTMTAPAADDPRPVNIAFASCQNYEQGFFGAWARMVSEDRNRPAPEQIQFVLHLGDFIYERYGYNDKHGERRVRKLPTYPDGACDGDLYWARTLEDYRHLYRTYLRDPHLQAARARWPFICTWDDHEFSNNGVGHFSTYDSELRPEPNRKTAANKAWLEFIPARVADDPENPRIYRQLRWGKQIDLLLTDLRSYRSPPPVPRTIEDATGNLLPVDLVRILDAGGDYDGGNPPRSIRIGRNDYPNSARRRAPGTMLGQTQKQWFKNRLEKSGARWKVWANSLPLIPLRLDLDQLPLADLPTSVLGQDSWSGYPGERNELMRYLSDNRIGNVISLSGDHHSHGAGTVATDLDARQPRFVAVDFNVTGISSTPQYNGVLQHGRQNNPDFLQLVAAERDGQVREIWNMTFTHGVLAALAHHRPGSHSGSEGLGPNKANPGLKYVDSNSNGYGLARFDEGGCEVQLVTIEPPLANAGPEGQLIDHTANFRVAAWSKGRQPRLEGPVFTGAAPFPFAGPGM